MPDPTVQKLEKAIQTLRHQRREHQEALAAIDAMFERLGLAKAAADGPGSAARLRRGRPPGLRKPAQAGQPKGGRKRRRRRSSFKTTGPVSIVAFVKAGGKGGRTTSEINAHWKKEGRTGDAYVALGNLVKARALKRKNIRGKRGSQYSTVGSSAAS